MTLAPLARAARLSAAAGLLLLALPTAHAQVCTDAQPSVTFAAAGSLVLPAGGDYTVTVTARGADGGRPSRYVNYGGSGATLVSRFVLPGGATLQAIPGRLGLSNTTSGGGGGGSAVSADGTLLTVAGGGGGAGQTNATGAQGKGGLSTITAPAAGGAEGAGVVATGGGGGGGGGFGVAGAGTLGTGGGTGSAAAAGAGGTGGGTVLDAGGVGGNGGAGVGGGGGGVNGGGGGGGYAGGDGGFASASAFGGGFGGTSYVNTGAFSGEVVSQQSGFIGGSLDRHGEVVIECAPVAVGATDVTFPGTDGLGNDTGWRLLAPTAAAATRDDLADDLDLTLTTPSGGPRLLRWTGRVWAPVQDADELGGGHALAVYLPDSADEPLTSAGIAVDFAEAPPTEAVAVGPLDDQTAFALFGNPFADAFDLGALAAEGFRDAVFVWDYEAMAYQALSRAAGDALAPGQAGFIRRDRIARGATALTLPAPAPARRAAAELGRARLAVTALDADGAVIGRSLVSAVLTPDATAGADLFDTPAPGPLASAFAVAALGDAGLGQEGLPLQTIATRLRVGAVGLGAASFEVRLVSVDGSAPLASVTASWDGATVDLTAGETLTVPASAVSEGVDQASALSGAADIPLTLAVGAVATGDRLEAPALDLAVAPNPVRGQARLTWTAAGPADVAVYDALGRRVAVVAEGSTRGAATFDAQALPAGVYVVRLTTSEGVAVRRLTVAR